MYTNIDLIERHTSWGILPKLEMTPINLGSMYTHSIFKIVETEIN